MSRTRKVFLYLAYFAIVAVLSGVIITSSKSNSPSVSKTPKAPVHTQHRPQTATAPPKTKAPSKPKPSTAAPAPSPAPTPAPGTAAGSQPLVDTGPGDVAGLFVAATLTGAILRRRILINRAG